MDTLRKMNCFEPARLRAIAAAIVLLAGSLGLTTSTALPAWADAVINAVSVLGPILLGESIRGAVYAPATVNAMQETGDTVVVDAPAAAVVEPQEAPGAGAGVVER